MALLWVSLFIWMLATLLIATTFGDDMASLLPRLPLTLDNFRDAWNRADWLEPVRQHPYLHLRHLLRATVDHHHRRLRLRLPRVSRQADAVSPVPGAADDHAGGDVMVPNMLTLKTFGLLATTLTGVMMPHFTSAFGVFLMRQAFLAIPKELEEAALMEGCRWWQVLFYAYCCRCPRCRCWPSPPSALPTTGTSTCGCR
ncbi:hypothetical protein MJ560_03545 [Klebsiella pneumoniae]|nr:hypothetical protein MJ560_03545 [Klebsiella pneumoniae]